VAAATCDQHPRYAAGCGGCRERSRTYSRLRYNLRRTGRWDGYGDTTEARDHINRLLSRDMTRAQIAAIADVNRLTVAEIANGRRPLAYRSAIAAILAVRPSPTSHSADALIDGTGCRRRLQALVVQAHATPYLASRLDTTTSTLWRWLRGDHRMVRTRTATRICRLFDELEFAHGTSAASLRIATRYGWMPALAWDLETIDDPAAEPVLPAGSDPADVDWAAVDLVCTGSRPPHRLTDATTAAIIKICARRGETDDLIGDRLGVSSRTAARWRRTHSIPPGVPSGREAAA
jgi:hypothetical protein